MARPCSPTLMSGNDVDQRNVTKSACASAASRRSGVAGAGAASIGVERTGLACRSMPRPISDFEPRERIVPIPHTTRRFSCRSGLAISPDNGTLAFIADLGAGTYSAWAPPPTKPGKPAPALPPDGAAPRPLAWPRQGALIGAPHRGGTEPH